MQSHASLLRLISIGVALTLIVVLAGCTREQPANPANTTINATNQVTNTELVPTEAPPSEAVLRSQLAVHFAERWGTYASDGNYENIEDLLDLMTERMRIYAEQLIATGRRNPQSATYAASRTIARTVTVISESNSRVEYVITTQRIETAGTTEREYYQDLRLILINVAGTWKVDEARWMPVTVR